MLENIDKLLLKVAEKSATNASNLKNPNDVYTKKQISYTTWLIGYRLVYDIIINR